VAEDSKVAKAEFYVVCVSDEDPVAVAKFDTLKDALFEFYELKTAEERFEVLLFKGSRLIPTILSKTVINVDSEPDSEIVIEKE